MKTNQQSHPRIARPGTLITLGVIMLLGCSQPVLAQWGTSTNNANNISNTNTGNVGVGTTTPSFKLEVKGSAGLPASSGSTGIGITRFSQGAGVGVIDFGFGGFSGAGWIQSTSSANLGSTFDLLLNPNGGRVGVGTTAPNLSMEIKGAVGLPALSGTTQSGITRFSQSSGTGVIDFGFGGPSGAGWLQSTSSANLGLNFDLLLNPNGGKVGIGTAGPGARLDLGANAVSNQFYVYNNGPSATYGMGATVANGLEIFTSTGLNKMAFGTFNQTTFTPQMVLNNGSLGIGTTPAPGFKLDVAGEIRSSAGFRFPDGSIQTTAAIGGGGGGGTITGVTAGPGLSGGGTTGSVTLTNTDRGSAQYIFKSIANGAGATQFSAQSNTDSLKFAGSGGTNVIFDPTARMVTIDATGSTGTAANTSAGQFGQNTGGGNYTFPADVTVNGIIHARYQDLAEWVPATHAIAAGSVVILDPDKSNQVMASAKAYDTRVAGVISEKPGLMLGESGEGRVLVATTGRVRVKVDATRGPIAIGDLLVTSDIEGVAMKSEPLSLGGTAIHRPGTLIGKALEPLAKGKGEILVLLSLQ